MTSVARGQSNAAAGTGGQCHQCHTAETLGALLEVYWRDNGPRLDAYLTHYDRRRLKNLQEAIRFACHGREGKIHGHQHRVGKAKKLAQARKPLAKHAPQLRVRTSFGELIGRVGKNKGVRNRF